MFHILTYGTNIEKLTNLKKSSELNKTQINYIIEPQFNYIGYESKIFKMREAIKNLLPNDIICFVDAYDVLALAPNTEILEKFKEYNCDLLIGSEVNSYPYGYDNKYPETNHETNYKHINSGGYIGYKFAIMNLFNWKSDEDIIKICKNGGDQTYFIEYYLSNNSDKIKMDYKQSIFQNMFLISWNDFIIKNSRIYNSILNQYPCFMHFNGLSNMTDSNIDIMNIFVNKLYKSVDSNDLILDVCDYKKSQWPNPTIINQLR